MYSKKFRFPIGKEPVRWSKTFGTPFFSLKIAGNTKAHNRFAVIISNHAVKKSTDRHFWKRQIADEFMLWPNLGKDFLVIVSSKIGSANKTAVKNELAKILQQLIVKELKS